MQPETARRLAWFAVIVGVCLNASTMLAQPVANSAAHLERARLQWAWLASDVRRAGDAAWARLQDLPPAPTLGAFVEAVQPADERRPDTTGGTTGTVVIHREGDTTAPAANSDARDAGALDAGPPGTDVPPPVARGDGPIREVVIQFEVNASWHYMKGEITFRPGVEPVANFAPTWRPILLMMAGAGLGLLIIGFVGLAMLRRSPASDTATR